MQRAADIRVLVEDEARRLTEALLAGEVALADGRTLADTGLSEGDVHQLAGEILAYGLRNRLLSVHLAALGAMEWLDMTEACLYARCSPNTLKKWAEEGKVEGSPPGHTGGGWRFNRPSIDRFLHAPRDERRAILAERRASAS